MSAWVGRFYHKDTGAIHPFRLVTTDLRAVALNTPADHIAIEGEFDPLAQRVDVASGKVVDYQPPQPSPEHEWNAVTKRWVLNAAVFDKAQERVAALQIIVALEASQARPMREATLGDTTAVKRLMDIDARIKALRAKL